MSSDRISEAYGQCALILLTLFARSLSALLSLPVETETNNNVMMKVIIFLTIIVRPTLTNVEVS
jgi:hypothetical protein